MGLTQSSPINSDSRNSSSDPCFPTAPNKHGRIKRTIGGKQNRKKIRSHVVEYTNHDHHSVSTQMSSNRSSLHQFYLDRGPSWSDDDNNYFDNDALIVDDRVNCNIDDDDDDDRYYDEYDGLGTHHNDTKKTDHMNCLSHFLFPPLTMTKHQSLDSLLLMNSSSSHMLYPDTTVPKRRRSHDDLLYQRGIITKVSGENGFEGSNLARTGSSYSRQQKANLLCEGKNGREYQNYLPWREIPSTGMTYSSTSESYDEEEEVREQADMGQEEEAGGGEGEGTVVEDGAEEAVIATQTHAPSTRQAIKYDNHQQNAIEQDYQTLKYLYDKRTWSMYFRIHHAREEKLKRQEQEQECHISGNNDQLDGKTYDRDENIQATSSSTLDGIKNHNIPTMMQPSSGSAIPQQPPATAKEKASDVLEASFYESDMIFGGME